MTNLYFLTVFDPSSFQIKRPSYNFSDVNQMKMEKAAPQTLCGRAAR